MITTAHESKSKPQKTCEPDTLPFSPVHPQCLDAFLQIKKSLELLEANYSNLQQKWEKLASSINKSILRVEKTYELTEQELLQINQDRLVVINQLSKALAAFRMASYKERIKTYWRPRLGTLQQYSGRPYVINKQYTKKISLTQIPTISIVTPSFNQGNFLERTILSIINQDYPSLEYIIQDGDSNDESLSIMMKYSAVLKSWESKKDNGQSHALNLGFKHATGDILAYLNSDDILLPGTLAYVADYFNKNPNVDVIYGHRLLIDENDQEIGRWVLPPHSSKVLAWADFVPQETLFWRRSIWEKVGATFDESFKFAMDWELLLRFVKAEARFARLPRFLGAFRVHTQQKTSAQMREVGLKEMDRLRINWHGHQVSGLQIKRNIFSYLVKHIICHKLYKAGIFRY